MQCRQEKRNILFIFTGATQYGLEPNRYKFNNNGKNEE